MSSDIKSSHNINKIASMSCGLQVSPYECFEDEDMKREDIGGIFIAGGDPPISHYYCLCVTVQ